VAVYDAESIPNLFKSQAYQNTGLKDLPHSHSSSSDGSKASKKQNHTNDSAAGDHSLE
jgi:hypothetical protein